MNRKEFTVQDALGLINTYVAYVCADGGNDEDNPSTYIQYTLKSYTRRAARHRLKKIVRQLEIKTGNVHTVYSFTGPEDLIEIDMSNEVITEKYQFNV